MSCRDKSLYVPKGVGCGDCEITKDGVLEALGYSASESTQTLPDGQGELDRLIIGKPLDRYPTSLTITTPPDKTDYEAGEFFDPTGIVVTVGYSDGTTAEAEHYDITVDRPLIQFGDNTYTVEYSELGITLTASSTVTVLTTDTVLRTLNGVNTLIINESNYNITEHTEAYGPITKNYGSIYDIDADNQAKVAGGQVVIMPWRNDDLTYAFCDLPCEIMIFQVFFLGQHNLISADLSNVTFTGTNIREMFSNCGSLTSFAFEDGFGSKIQKAYVAFGNCTSLISFSMDTPNLEDASSMFSGCTGIRSIDIDLTNANEVSEFAFKNCTSLEYLSIGAFGTVFTTTYDLGYNLWLNTLSSLPISEMYSIFEGLADVTPTNPNPQIRVSQAQNDAYTAEYTDFSIVTDKGWSITIT